jgi:hypothetical protein
MDLSKDINTINRLGNSLKVLKTIETALTVGIIAFTVLRVFYIIREKT